uniref:Uncharacterized protein n=1 Tax=Opuntia streptacantha TaxID=393608 RepID=A0A7C9AYS7_OPUST
MICIGGMRGIVRFATKPLSLILTLKRSTPSMWQHVMWQSMLIPTRYTEFYHHNYRRSKLQSMQLSWSCLRMHLLGHGKNLLISFGSGDLDGPLLCMSFCRFLLTSLVPLMLIGCHNATLRVILCSKTLFHAFEVCPKLHLLLHFGW